MAVAYVDRDLVFRLANKAAALQRGMVPASLVGRPLGKDLAAPFVQEVLATGRPTAAYTVCTADTYWDHAF